MDNIKVLLQCERSSVFLMDREDNMLWTQTPDLEKEIRIPLGQGIVGRVADMGTILHAPDAYENEYFNREVDIQLKLKTRNVLAYPIKNGTWYDGGYDSGVLSLSLYPSTFFSLACSPFQSPSHTNLHAHSNYGRSSWCH